MTSLILILSGLSGVFYGFRYAASDIPSFERSILKTVPVALLALAAGVEAHLLLAFALALSALGDLALSRDGEKAFLIGLGFFLLAHLAYVGLFGSLVLVQADPRWLFLGLLLAFSIAMLTLLWKHLGDLALPVVAYFLAILAMGMCAVSLPGPFWLVIVGVLLFIASDSILATEVFLKIKNRLTSILVWALYFSGQFLITVGIL